MDYRELKKELHETIKEIRELEAKADRLIEEIQNEERRGFIEERNREPWYSNFGE